MVNKASQYIWRMLLMLCCINIAVYAFGQFDTVIVKQGDRLIGSFQTMSKGIANIITPYSNHGLEIKWADIEVLKTTKRYRLFNEVGKLYVGFINIDTAYRGKVKLITKDTTLLLNITEVADISIYEKGFLHDRLKITTDVGYTITKQNNTSTGSLGVNLNYIAKRWAFAASYQGFLSKVDSLTSKRGSLEANVQYVLGHNWFVIGKAGSYYSTEQDLSNRVTLLLGVGNYVIRRANSLLYGYSGATYNSEKFTLSASKFQSWETFGATHYEYNVQKGINLQADFIVFSSLTDADRIRTYAKADVGYNFSTHFKAGVQFVLNTDSKPPVQASKTDYIYSFKVGWHL